MSAHATIHVGLKQLGIEGDDARDLYERQTGKRSLREMTPKQHDAVIGELRRLGFKPVLSGPRKRLEGRFATKLQALWIAGWNLGVVRERDDAALIKFIQRQTGIDHVRFLRDGDDAHKAIEAIKGWLAREGGVDWRQGNHLPDWLRRDGAKIAIAQWQILARAGEAELTIAGFRGFVAEQAKPVDQMLDRDWIAVMNALGEKVRRVKAK